MHRLTTARGSSRRAVLAAALGAGLLTLAACGGSSSAVTAASSAATPSAASSSAPAAFPVTVTGQNGPVTLDAQPSHIVSLSPTATEVLFAIGAGAQVTAVDDQSSYPTDAPKTKLSGFQPNAEAVAGYKPDLVIASNDANGLVAALTKLDVPVLVLPAAATLDEAYAQWATIGQVTGHGDDATKVVKDTQDRIAAAVASVPASVKGQKVYHELDNTFYSATSATFIGSIYTLFGLTNIADGAKDASGGYPQLSAEYVVKQAPDLIVLADTKCCQQSAASLAKRPGFDGIPAVKNGRVVEGDDDIASRWGPRVADFTTAVASELAGQ
ncbi:ABC transporter substrate-binding protein [Kineosporia sp. A_224]|uniref:ABC transporter substrate-binding protein n=1 Tax=Kineosporia sp. A_224 TaxID=1962180 RepID=UPI000B4B808A|nr:ABC transporter substrate-binding protein [Kineosporia sp. A_224]